MMTGAIFDFDGTLFDSMSIWDTAGADYLRSLGRKPAAGLSKTLSAMSLHQAARYLGREYDLHLSEEAIVEGIDRTVEDFYLHTARPKANVPAFLERLRLRGVKLCIATATDRHLIQGALDHWGLGDAFCGILTCTDVGHGKDEPHIYEAALALLGTQKKQTVVFEDALHAIRTAKQAGFPVAAVFDAHEPDPQGVRSLADWYLEHF